MSTHYVVRIARPALSSEHLAALQEAVEQRLDELDRCFSVFRPDSELSRFNAIRSTEPFSVSPELAAVTRFALDVARHSHGAFDPTLGPLIDLWGFGRSAAPQEPPDAKAVQAIRALTGWQHLEVLPGPALRKAIPELQVNFGAVAKGHAADEIARLLQEKGCTDFLVTIGGETVAVGLNPAGQPWRIGVDAPLYNTLPGEALLRVVLLGDGGTLSTSGDYRRYRRDTRGRVFSHLIDGRNGRPITNTVASVTVAARDAMTADGLATALAVLGPENNFQLLEHYPGVEALLVIRQPDDSLREIATPGFDRMCTQTKYVPIR